jgi:hypothetical protein
MPKKQHTYPVNTHIKPKLTYIFHNPNTEERTVKCITEILTEAAVLRVRKAQEKQIEKVFTD